MLILRSYTVSVRLHDVTKFQTRKYFQANTFQANTCQFLTRKYDVISQLRYSYAKDPLCVTRLILFFYTLMAYRVFGLPVCLSV